MKPLHDYAGSVRQQAPDRRSSCAVRSLCEIDLGAIAENLRAVRGLLAAGTKVAAVVKADAYGHGARRVAMHLQRLGIEWFAVATVAEGVELRRYGITGQIITLNAFMPAELDLAVTHSITVSIGSAAEAAVLNQIAFHLGRTAKAHIVVDTGLSRGGFAPQELVNALPALQALDSVFCEGMWTHFASLRSLPDARAKVESFRGLAGLARRYLPLSCIHMAGSVATVRLRESHFDMVRPGIALYGYLPHTEHALDLKPAMTVTAPLVAVRRYPAGTPLSYEGLHVLPRDANIGIVRHGYAEGYDVHLTNTGRVTMCDTSYPVVGRITMDQMLIDLGDDERRPGERVTLFGRAGPSALDVAQRAGSLPHAVLVAVGGRIAKTWIGAEDGAPAPTFPSPARHFAGL